MSGLPPNTDLMATEFPTDVGEEIRRMLDQVSPEESIVPVMQRIAKLAASKDIAEGRLLTFLQSDEEVAQLLRYQMATALENGLDLANPADASAREREETEVTEDAATEIKKMILVATEKLKDPTVTIDHLMYELASLALAEGDRVRDIRDAVVEDDDFIEALCAKMIGDTVPTLITEEYQRIAEHKTGLTDELKTTIANRLSEAQPEHTVRYRLEQTINEALGRVDTDRGIRFLLQYFRSPAIRAICARNVKEAIREGIRYQEMGDNKSFGRLNQAAVHEAMRQKLPALYDGETMYELFAHDLQMGQTGADDLIEYATQADIVDEVVAYIVEVMAGHIVLQKYMARHTNPPGKLLKLEMGLTMKKDLMATLVSMTGDPVIKKKIKDTEERVATESCIAALEKTMMAHGPEFGLTPKDIQDIVEESGVKNELTKLLQERILHRIDLNHEFMASMRGEEKVEYDGAHERVQEKCQAVDAGTDFSDYKIGEEVGRLVTEGLSADEVERIKERVRREEVPPMAERIIKAMAEHTKEIDSMQEAIRKATAEAVMACIEDRGDESLHISLQAEDGDGKRNIIKNVSVSKDILTMSGLVKAKVLDAVLEREKLTAYREQIKNALEKAWRVKKGKRRKKANGSGEATRATKAAKTAKTNKAKGKPSGKAGTLAKRPDQRQPEA